jgi:cytochrome c-type biogenesis protein CcmH
MTMLRITVLVIFLAIANMAGATTTKPAPEATTPVTAAPGPSAAPARPIQFRDRAEERRFRALTEQLRCVMCQNQSLADSNAMIAQDLRLEVLQLMRDGNSDAQIKTFLVERYTDFVLYKPELKPRTWLLWFGPALLLIGGTIAIIVIVRKQKATGATPPGDQEQEW